MLLPEHTLVAVAVRRMLVTLTLMALRMVKAGVLDSHLRPAQGGHLPLHSQHRITEVVVAVAQLRMLVHGGREKMVATAVPG